MPEFDRIAEELYRLPPTEFVAARDERAREARRGGDAQLAKEVRDLRRPTRGAWVVNQLWRQRPDELKRLLAVGEQLREATAQLAADRLRELSRLRRDLIEELLRGARDIGRRAGITLDGGLATEVESTLNAAVADPGIADQLRGGRMVKAAEYAGFGPHAFLSGSHPEAVRKRPEGEAPGRQRPGHEAPAGETRGRKTPGVKTSGAKTPGAKTLGAKTLGAKTPGRKTPGRKTPGRRPPGSPVPGGKTTRSGRGSREGEPQATAGASDANRAARLAERVDSARMAADTARSALADAIRQVEDAEAQERELDARRDQLRRQLRDLADQVTAAGRQRRRADALRVRAERALERAERDLRTATEGR